MNAKLLWSPVEGSASDPAGDVVRWAAFSCLLVPVVLVVYGSSFAGAAGSAIGLMAVTAACRLLLRRSERAAADGRGEVPLAPSGRAGRASAGGRRGGRHGGGRTPGR
ncbi:hypothetical protein ABR738_15170 [Streptomyces sp. Edi4]|uniref:hypothetical protein n=1 Tax=Streptomyces sp. Edi4 TaxID=3162527 RepID=UPI003305DCB7